MFAISNKRCGMYSLNDLFRRMGGEAVRIPALNDNEAFRQIFSANEMSELAALSRPLVQNGILIRRSLKRAMP